MHAKHWYMYTTNKNAQCWDYLMMLTFKKIKSIVKIVTFPISSGFCQGEMSEKDFNKAVYKLNHNVLYLCFTQKVAPELLQPRHTVHNLLMLLKASQLGR